MVGYFLRNEPEWAFVQGLIIADKVLFTRAVTELNREVYAIADGRRSDPAPEVHRIPRMMGF